ncbi:YadA C-terminal domain-containing protein [Qipengyuania sp. RANM35]|uniref:YadA C-terminal domain-containing protein n=1 Tax=Qipengyuania sp. RANM35 TaxID=3068635 RepID=UPI0034DB27EC
MRTHNNAGRSAVAAGLLASTAAIGLVGATPAAAQEACTVYTGFGVECTEPTDVDVALSTYDYSGIADGAYDNLDSKIEQTAPTQDQIDAAQADVDAATDAATALNGAEAAVTASLTQDNLDAFAAVTTAEADLAAATAAEAAAADVVTVADAAYNDAADALTAANQSVTDANIALSAASDDVAAAQAAYDADQSTANLAALNAALVARAEAQQDLSAAEADRTVALADATAAADALDAAQVAFDAAVDTRVAAADDLSTALSDLDTSLASNTDFVDAITDAGYTASADGLQNLTADAASANQDLAAAEAQFAGLDDVTNTFIRAQEVLVGAAENQNAAIAAASQALLGDPRAAETNSEVEVIAALVDHEDRITANEATLVDHETRITANEEAIVVLDERVTANEATLIEHDARITANSEAIVAEADARAAADTVLLDTITSETNARIAADTALSNRIDTVSNRVDVLETRIADFDDRISSSTATAIALGGMAFLPDMRFNLAVTGGFYEGANAVAANMGLRVSDNVAVTAGVGGGLNKNGKIGGRVGVIFGW